MKNRNVNVKGGKYKSDTQCINNKSIKKKDWSFSCRSYTEKYIFCDVKCTQKSGKHIVNLANAQDYEGKEYVYTNIDDFCKKYDK